MELPFELRLERLISVEMRRERENMRKSSPDRIKELGVLDRKSSGLLLGNKSAHCAR